MTNKDIFRELGALEPELIVKADPEAGTATNRPARLPIYKKAIAGAAALLLAISLVALNFEAVSAAARRLFSFIPGVGIQMELDGTAYAYQAITKEIDSETRNAKILSATYADGELSAVIQYQNKEGRSEEVALRLYKDGTPAEADIRWSIGSEHALASLTVPTDAPAEDDLFEIEFEGFSERLSFSMRACERYDELCEIGPTAVQNGIAITATAERQGNELTVWCYETRTPEATKDKLISMGIPAAGNWSAKHRDDDIFTKADLQPSSFMQRYMESESGRLTESTGFQVKHRGVYEMAETDTTATLHIPYLAMRRDEQVKTVLTLPSEYTRIETDIAVETSLGNIRITAIEREEYKAKQDRIHLQISFENKSETECMYALSHVLQATNQNKGSTSDESRLQSIYFSVDKGASEHELIIDSIYYYLMGEYEIPLDIQ